MTASASTSASGAKWMSDGWKAAAMLAVAPAGSNSTGSPKLQKSRSATRSEGPEVRSNSPKCW